MQKGTTQNVNNKSIEKKRKQTKWMDESYCTRVCR